MGLRVVTIAMSTGARAEQVGRLVAEHLGFQYYNLDEELPTHYDFVVNTDVLSPEAVARVIAYAAANP